MVFQLVAELLAGAELATLACGWGYLIRHV